MKNPAQEMLRRRMRQFHRHHQWQLAAGGVYIPRLYAAYRPLSWWDDVGFVLNHRRIMVWWIHPRMKYADAIEDRAWAEVGSPPHAACGFFAGDKIWKRVGRSRKKVAAYHSKPAPADRQAFHEKLHDIGQRLEEEGIDLLVRPFMTMKTFGWCTGIDLCIPVEVHSDADAKALAVLAKRLIKGETTLADEFPEYRYGRDAWLAEAPFRDPGVECAVVA